MIRYGYGNEDYIKEKPLHVLLSRYEWFRKNEEEEIKRTIQLHKCPFMSTSKRKSSNKKMI